MSPPPASLVTVVAGRSMVNFVMSDQVVFGAWRSL